MRRPAGWSRRRLTREVITARAGGWSLDRSSDARHGAERSLEGSADRELMQEAVNRDGRALLKDRDTVLEAVKQDRIFVQFAFGELRKDREIVLEAVKQNGRAFHFASEELRNDRVRTQAGLRTQASPAASSVRAKLLCTRI